MEFKEFSLESKLLFMKNTLEKSTQVAHPLPPPPALKRITPVQSEVEENQENEEIEDPDKDQCGPISTMKLRRHQTTSQPAHPNPNRCPNSKRETGEALAVKKIVNCILIWWVL